MCSPGYDINIIDWRVAHAWQMKEKERKKNERKKKKRLSDYSARRQAL